MGYHLINIENNRMETFYIENIEDLVEYKKLHENCIVYEADRKWIPFLIKDHTELSMFLNDAIRFGIKGQRYFEKILKENKILYEKIEQTKEKLQNYIDSSNGKRVKRGDYLIRGKNRIEIEVKVRTFYKNENYNYFTLNYSEIKSLENMQEITKDSIFFVILERKNEEIMEIPYILGIDKLLELNKYKSLSYNEKGKYFEISLSHCLIGLDKLKEICG